MVEHHRVVHVLPPPDGYPVPVATKSGDRAAHWPAIERKHGEPMAHWFALMETVADRKYEEQMALLQEQHGFSRAHANAVVMYCRGSTTSKRYGTLDDYLEGADPTGAATLRAIFAAIADRHPDLELVMAWNQPILKSGDAYVFGASLQRQHILIAPFRPAVIAEMAPRLAGFTVNKKTVRVPIDWDVDAALLQDMVGACLMP